MEQHKPKKALRGLFTRTEPEPSDIKKVEPKIDTTLIANTSNANTEILEPTVSSAPLHSLEVIKNEPHVEKKDLAYTVTKIQYQFDAQKIERNTWSKNEYISFLNRIDNAQTEAFFLKGKMISEIKERFYASNKNGWKQFCEEHLNMYYTTANQYIRVSEEFDVTTYRRTDFGFEHFKALLSVPTQERNKIIEQLPNNVSVKSLRNIITGTVLKETKASQNHNNKKNIKSITDNFEKIKYQLENLNLNELEQSEKWSLLGAFNFLSEEMEKMSEILSKPNDSKYNSRHLGATSALSEEEYVSS
jgi:hypothetical protein